MKRTLFALGAIGMGVILSLGRVEVAMRLGSISYPMFRVPDPVAGILLWPNLGAWFTAEGEEWIEINSEGFRDVNHEAEKPDDEFRIVFLGDSYTEAMQVAFDETYWSVAARALEGCPALRGRKPMPINLGISGIGTAQELAILRAFAWQYDPDFVVLAFVANDIQNNHPGYGAASLKPFYVDDESGQFVLDDSFKTSPEFRSRTSTLRTLRRQAIQSSRVLQLAVELWGESNRRAALAVGKDRRGTLSRPPVDATLSEAWRFTEAAIARVAQDVREKGLDFLLFSVTSGHQVHPDRKYREEFLRDSGGGDLLYWNRRVGQFAGRNSIAYVDLVDPFQEFAEASGSCLHGFDNAVPCGGHWNVLGHRLAGERVAEAICLQVAERSSRHRQQ